MTKLEKNYNQRLKLFAAMMSANNENFKSLFNKKIDELVDKASRMTLYEAGQDA